MADLRSELLSLLLIALFIMGCLWAFLLVLVEGEIAPQQAGVFVLFLSVYLAERMRHKSYRLASWALLSALALITAWYILQGPSLFAAALGLPLLIMAGMLLGTQQALLLTGGLLILQSLAWHAGMNWPAMQWTAVSRLAILCLATWGAIWLANRPLSTSISWALDGWGQARAALQEVRDRRGELARTLHALEEATYRIERMNNELIVARRQAEEARALKSRLVATVSHELRGPLNLVLGFSKLMALSPESYGEPLPVSYRADVHAIYRNSQHLVALVDDILDLSQIEAERLPLVKDQTDLNADIVTKAVEIVRPLAQRKGLYVRQSLAGGIPQVYVDPVRLRQAVLNLMHNAIRLTATGGITVETSLGETEVVISVEDTGPGIAREDMPKLFKEFHQLQLPSKDAEETGSGLGLAISKHLIELHGGRIWVESKEGRGTRFSFSVPLPGHEKESMTRCQPMLRSVQQEGRENRNCLVLHKDLAVVRLLARHVEGYHMISVPDMEGIVALVQDLHPHAILADEGEIEALHSEFDGLPYDVPIISCHMPLIASQPHLQAIHSYLVKPISAEALASVLRQVDAGGVTEVLLVDDDPDAVRLLERMIVSMPSAHRIMKAYDGEQALEMMGQDRPDVVFLDLMMPGVSGEEVIVEMDRQEELAEVPIVVVSARDWVEGSVAVNAPISLHTRRSVEIGRAARCLTALLDVLSPDYLS